MALIRTVVGCVLVALTTSAAFGKEEIPPNPIAGKQVEADARLPVGTKLVGIWDKKNYIVQIVEIKKDKQIRIHWVGFDKNEDVDVSPSTLYFIADTTPTRKVRTSPLPKEYQALDKNGDGQIGLYEWERAKYAEFRKLDKNKDGFLTPQEFAGKAGPAPGTPAAVVAGKDPKEPKDALPDPGNLEAYNGLIGQSFTFAVTGRAEGLVVGTGTFTSGSDLAVAAVHAGLVKVGSTGNVTASIIATPESFSGSTANGVTSGDSPPYTAAYTLKAQP